MPAEATAKSDRTLAVNAGKSFDLCGFPRGENETIHSWITDCILLALVMAVSVLPYITQLGFYGDDWAFLRSLNSSSQKSIIALTKVMFANEPRMRMRPVQALLLSVYGQFGLNPLRYHLMNSLVLIVSVLLFYLLVRASGQSRLLAYALAVVYGLLPQYSTDRFWMASSQAGISIVFCLVASHAGLFWSRVTGSRRVALATICIVCSVASLYSYEITFGPLLLLPILILHDAGQPKATNERLVRDPRLTFIVVYLTVLFSASIFKVILLWHFTGSGLVRFYTYKSLFGFLLLVPLLLVYFNKRFAYRSSSIVTKRFTYGLAACALVLVFIVAVFRKDILPQHIGTMWTILSHAVIQSLDFNFGRYFLELPVVLWHVFRARISAFAFSSAVVIGATIFFRLRSIWPKDAAIVNFRGPLTLIGIGLLLFFAGFFFFLSNTSLHATTTGVDNRVALAAGFGTAAVVIGTFGLLCTLLTQSSTQRFVFCLGSALMCAGWVLVIATLGSFWGAAYQQQISVMSNLRSHVPRLTSESTLLLDGICPYIGPGIVFETSWDVSGALRILYSDQSLNGDVVKRGLKINHDGISTVLYGEVNFYPYSTRLFVYNVKTETLVPLPDVATSQQYFTSGSSRFQQGCPPATEGEGVAVF